VDYFEVRNSRAATGNQLMMYLPDRSALLIQADSSRPPAIGRSMVSADAPIDRCAQALPSAADASPFASSRPERSMNFSGPFRAQRCLHAARGRSLLDVLRVEAEPHGQLALHDHLRRNRGVVCSGKPQTFSPHPVQRWDINLRMLQQCPM